MPPTDTATEISVQETTVAPSRTDAETQAAARRFASAVGTPHEHGVRGALLVLLTGMAALWFGLQAGRGFWRGDQEWQLSAMQAALALLFVWLLFAISSFSSMGLAAGIVVLMVAGEMAVEAAVADRSRIWMAGGVVAVCLFLIHYLVVRRADFGHRAVIQPFQPGVPAEPGLMDWLSGAAARENVLIAINNAIAEADRITDLPPLALSEVAKAGGYELKQDFASERAWLYRAYLAHFVADGTLGDDDAAQLAHLSRLLFLPAAAVNDAHRRVGGELYREKVKAAAVDGSLEPGEKAELAEVERAMALNEKEARLVRKEAFEPVSTGVVNRVLEDGMLTDAEATELAELGQRLDVNVRDDERTRAMLDRARTVYHVLHGELPQVAVSFNARDGEVCYAERQARWVDWDTVESTRYVTTGSVREVPSWFGKPHLEQESETREVHDSRTVKQNLGSGRLLATNQRLVFIGSPNNRSYDYEDLLDVTHGPESLVLHRDGSTNILFELDRDADLELFSLIIGRAMRDA